ncbi:MAG: SDR family oxidoreductase [Cyclobacteriaceae bacterium]
MKVTKNNKSKMKTILIIGSGAGISLSVAYRFAREGFQIIFYARNERSLQSLTQKINEIGFKASYYVGDVTDFESMKTVIREIYQKFSIDVMLYNAAAATAKNIEDLTTEQLNNDFNVNVTGALNVARTCLQIQEKDRPMALLFTGGGLALKPFHEYTSLSIGKAGLRSLVFSLAQEFKNRNVKIGTVTVAGFVKKGTRFDPDRIANEFWQLYSDPARKYEVEIIYK